MHSVIACYVSPNTSPLPVPMLYPAQYPHDLAHLNVPIGTPHEAKVAILPSLKGTSLPGFARLRKSHEPLLAVT